MVRMAGFFSESRGENRYFMGNFYTLKYLACMLMGCNNEPVLYEVSTNIFFLICYCEGLQLVSPGSLEHLGPSGGVA